MAVRIYLTGRICIEADGSLIDERMLPARQGRRAFAYLACARARPVPREELADAVWGDAPPDGWDAALSALVSKLRTTLARSVGGIEIATVSGAHELRLPHDGWLDIEAAAIAIDEAEGAARAADRARAWGSASVACAIAARPFLASDSAPWIERQRTALRDIHVRAIELLADLNLADGRAPLAIQFAARCIDLEPYRETAYQRLMRAHALAGNRAEALRAYERCRRLLAEELGADPSPETERIYLELLRE